MVKRKARTTVSVADGAGGMMEVKDRRFEGVSTSLHRPCKGAYSLTIVVYGKP
jgi:hypothetical protein